MKTEYQAGNFTGLANDYSLHRPDYSSSVLNGLLGLLEKRIDQIDCVDIGAGTGIWSRMIAEKGIQSVIAVEPNDDMRNSGIEDSRDSDINWKKGGAEETLLPDNCCDWVTMASSFHWTDFNKATKEFYRILRPAGHFTALWNPRLIEVNPLLVEIEECLNTLRTDIKRVSSGLSGITETLTEQLWCSPYFEDVVYMEGRHIIEMSPERYIGAWRSVNDLRVQLGSDKFDAFLDIVQDKIDGLDKVEATYLTRAWSARRIG